jgi:hypothetical protein
MIDHRILAQRLDLAESGRFESVAGCEFTVDNLLIPATPVIMGIRFGRSSSVG